MHNSFYRQRQWEFSIIFTNRLLFELHTIKLGCKELSGGTGKMFVKTVIFTTVKIHRIKSHLAPKIRNYFARYKREFVITLIVIAEFECILICHLESGSQSFNLMAHLTSFFYKHLADEHRFHNTYFAT